MGDVIKDIIGIPAQIGDQVNDATGLTNTFDPGRNEREDARANDKLAQELYMKTLPKDPAGNYEVYGWNDPQFTTAAPVFGQGQNDLRFYGTQQPFLGTHQSAWTDGGDSNFGDLNVDTSGMQDAAGYFEGLVQSGGRDAASEAEYARRVEQAERARRANTEGALRALETQGRGGSGASLLASLGNSQAQVSDQYQAGLDASAIAQARKDAAATANYGAATDIARANFDADQARMAGQDAWGMWEEGQKAMTAENNAVRAQGVEDKRYDRANTVNDANVDLQNQRAWWEGPGRGQAAWDRQQGALAGATGQLGNQAQGLRDDGKSQYGAGKDVMGLLGKLYGGGG